MTGNEAFVDAIELGTSGSGAVVARFDIWRTTLDAILAPTAKQPRCFSRELKAQLYAANPTCKLCGQHIAELDDASVDHIEHYWLGGQTIPDNARLTHRYCNWSRAKFDPVNP